MLGQQSLKQNRKSYENDARLCYDRYDTTTTTTTIRYIDRHNGGHTQRGNRNGNRKCGDERVRNGKHKKKKKTNNPPNTHTQNHTTTEYVFIIVKVVFLTSFLCSV